MKSSVQPAQSESRELELSAPVDFALPARWLAAADLRGTLTAIIWLTLGPFLSHIYVYGVIVPPPWIESPDPLFPPQAIILAALLLNQRNRWWPLLAVYYAVMVAQGVGLDGLPLWYALLSNVANVIEPLVGALLICHFILRPTRFSTLTSVAAYVACVTVGSLLGATWGSTARALGGAPFWDSWSGWFLADVLASLVLAPMIILWVRAGPAGLRPQSRPRLVEAAALGGAIVLLGTPWFSHQFQDAERIPLLYLPVPLLVWAAVRFGPRGLLTALSLVTVLVIAGAANDMGPMAGQSNASNIFTLQVFLLSIGVPLLGLATLVLERQASREQLEQSEERYRAVVASLPHGAVLLFGPDLRHTFADGQGLPLLGLSKADIEDKSLGECFPAEMASLLQPHYQAALDGSRHTFDMTYKGRTYQAEILPVTSVDTATGMLLLQDVTHERLATLLAAANEELELSNQAKSELVSDVSHELRTPLSSIQAYSELIRDEELLVGEMKEFSGYINQEAQRVSRMVNDLLDLDSVESGRMALHPELLDLNALVDEIAGSYRGNAPRYVIRLELEPTLPLVTGDRDRLSQVLINLLSNAVNYSPEGGEVTIGTMRDPTWAHLWVRDQGIGIPEKDLERIFERYTRVAAGDHPHIQGIGLGLPIVRHIAERHIGRVWAESELRCGSTFHLTLPLPSEAPAGTAQPPGGDDERT